MKLANVIKRRRERELPANTLEFAIHILANIIINLGTIKVQPSDGPIYQQFLHNFLSKLFQFDSKYIKSNSLSTV